MDALTIEQKQLIRRTSDFLHDQLNDQPATPAALVQILPAVAPAADLHAAEDFLNRVQDGSAQFERAYTACAAQTELPQAEQAAAYLVKDLDSRQRKGLYLQGYELMRQYHADCGLAEAQAAERPAGLAALSEDELQSLFTEQLEALSEGLAQELSGPPDAVADPLSHAAAVFAAAGNGDLPSYYAGSPEMLGACLAAGQTFAAQPGQDRERVIAILAAVTIAIVVAALVVPAILPAAATADAALAGLVQNLLTAVPAIATEGGGFYLLRLLLGLVGSLGTAGAYLTPFAAGALTYAAAKRIQRFYRERIAPHPAAAPVRPIPAAAQEPDEESVPMPEKA